MNPDTTHRITQLLNELFEYFGDLISKQKTCKQFIYRFLDKFDMVSAEREGFEPPDLWQSTVFKTAAFDRSAISPAQKYGHEYFFPKDLWKRQEKKKMVNQIFTIPNFTGNINCV